MDLIKRYWLWLLIGGMLIYFFFLRGKPQGPGTTPATLATSP